MTDDWSHIRTLPPASMTTMVDVLRWRAASQPDRVGYIWLRDGEVEESRLTYVELERAVRDAAAQLRALASPGERVLLLYPQGLDFIAALLGCLSAGLVAVPIAVPRRPRDLERLRPIVQDARPSVVMIAPETNPVFATAARENFDSAHVLVWPQGEGGQTVDSTPLIDDLALLQYTSGSTAAPRGVMIRHRQLMANESAIHDAFGHDAGTVIAGWLPFFHDMGLIGNLLQPLYAGVPCVLMSPGAFIQRPLRWLRMISNYRATTSGGPNFAYDLCARYVSEADKQTLDLSAWRVAFTGAEPVRAATLRRFEEAFTSCGFRPTAWLPCYGLAEATLMVSGRNRRTSPTVLAVDRAALRDGRVLLAGDGESSAIVGCGPLVTETTVAIVDPATGSSSPSGRVGEILVTGPGVADGYWSDQTASRDTFRATLPGQAASFLRTGDLGFMADGELFIAGRLKDLIIIGGRNHHPHDLELTAQNAHRELGAYGAAFGIDDALEERVVIVHESASRTVSSGADVCAAVREAIARDHELELHAVVLVPRGAIPKTTSGKVRRTACRELFVRGELPIVTSWSREIAVGTAGPAVERHTQLDAVVARVLGEPVCRIPADTPLVSLGLSSMRAIELSHVLEAEFGVIVTIDELLDSLTMGELAARMNDAPGASAREQQTASCTDDALSANEESLFFLQRLTPGSAAYHVSCLAALGGIELARVREALAHVMRAHPALRTTIVERDHRPWMHVADDANVPWQDILLDGYYEDEAQRDNTTDALTAVRGVARAEAGRPFAFDAAPLWRATAIRSPGGEDFLLLTFHHLIVDLWSLTIFWRALRAALDGPRALAARRERIAEPGPQRMSLLRDFWTRRLDGREHALNLPLDRPRPLRQRHRGARATYQFDGEVTARVMAFSRERHVTPFVVLLAVFEAVLARYAGQDEFLLATPVSGRERLAARAAIGYFVNPVVLRADLTGDPTFAELIGRVRSEVRDALRHADLPFATVANLVQPRRSLDRAPLCDVMFVYQDSTDDDGVPAAAALGLDADPIVAGGGSIRLLAFGPGTSQRDLTWTMGVVEGRLAAMVDYDTDLFDAAFADGLFRHYRVLLDGCLRGAERRLSLVSMMTDEERHLLVARPSSRRALTRDHDVNGDSHGRPAGEIEAHAFEMLHRRFEQQAALTPEAIALSWQGASLTYDQLNRRANRLARCLREYGAGPERLIAIYLDRSLDLMVALLATLKTGAAYLPLDPIYPSERIAFMAGDARPLIAVTHHSLAANLPDDLARLCVDVEAARIDAHEDTNLDIDTHPLNLAYVIYTSGSSGRPKGCALAHRNVLRLFDALPPELRSAIGPETWAMSHSPAFDFSVWEMWGAWLGGGRLVIVPHEVCRAPETFARLVANEGVTVLSQTPTAFRTLLDVLGPEAHTRMPAVRWIVFGGEALDFHSLRPWFGANGESGATLVNMYGITETTVHVTWRLVEAVDVADGADAGRRGNSFIGTALPDLSVTLLDPHLQPAPAGVAGEIHVGGAGLARGYLNRPDLTAARFVPDPYATEPGARLYRSGDLARHTRDGELEYLGRGDQQVQIHGYRVEPGEVEAALSAHPSVAQAVVIARPARAEWMFDADERDRPAIEVRNHRRYLKSVPAAQASPTETRLVAYVVPRAGERPSIEALRTFLAERVPGYMMPSAFVLLDRLPTTASGKVHRGALPAPEDAASVRETLPEPPRTPAQRAIADAWRDVLGRGDVGIDDNFFAAGGDSILAIRVLAKAAASGLTISVEDLYRHQTIRELAASLAIADQADLTGLGAARELDGPSASIPFDLIASSDRLRLPSTVEDAYPLSRMQAGLVFHSDQHPESPVYRASFLYRFDGVFDPDAFRAAVRGVVERHAVLRTAFDLVRFREPLQLVYLDVEPAVVIDDLRGFSEAAQVEAIDAWFARERGRGFDVTRAPLARFTAHWLGDAAFTVGLTCHDAILDGWSTALVLTELLQRYDARRGGREWEPAASSCSYREFVALERRDLAAAECREFWSRMLSGYQAAPLPVAVSNGAGGSHDSIGGPPRLGVVDVHLPPALSRGLTNVAREAGVSLKHVLLAAHLRVIQTWTGAPDVVTGLEVNGRAERSGGEVSVGQHLNTAPFRFQIGDESWLEAMQRIARLERDMQKFRRFPYAEIQRLHGGRPFYDTTFNYTHFHVFRALGNLRSLRLIAGHGRELTHYALKTEFNRDAFTDRLNLDVIFDASRMPEAQARAIAGSYLEVLQRIVSSPGERCRAAACVGADEVARLKRCASGPSVARPVTSLVTLCEAQRNRTPDAPAVEFEGRTMSFAALHARANRMARGLRRRGIGRETMVGIHLDRSFELIVALLAVLKAGAAYVPLDPGYPIERLATMARRSIVDAIICTASQRREWGERSRASILVCDQFAAECAEEDSDDLDEAIDPSQAAYTLFTSGSTGEPKGAINTHEGICNRLLWMQEAYTLDSTDRVLQKTPIGFDVSGWEFFWPLIAGATMVIARPGGHTDPEYLAAIIQEARVTTVHFVPSMLRLFLDQRRVRGCVSLRRVVCSGEALTADLARRCHELLSCDLHNLYGPTEAAIDVTAWTCIPADTQSAVPIGMPIANTRAFVLDRDLLPCPAGVAGELFLAGPQLARGYVGRADLTAERFLPCAWPDASSGARMYRTGDLARLRADGAIEFLGRIDAQVKLHGVRIEPEEIEVALASHPACGAAAAVVQEDGAGHAQLVAYVVPKAGTSVSWVELRPWLAARLPAAMVPSRIETLAELPRTASGKLDRRRLASSPTGGAPDDGEVAALLDLLDAMSDDAARQRLADVGRV